MNYLKRVAVVFLLFVVILLVVSMFLPSNIHVERSVIIDADEEQIFKQINELKNWKNWSPWILRDAIIYDKEEAYSNPSSGLGATFHWDSDDDEIGEGSIEILTSEPNTFVENRIKLGSFDGVGEWRFKDVQFGFEVIWLRHIEFGFNPLSKFRGLFLEDRIASSCESGLDRLKVFVENLPKIHRVAVSKKNIDKDIWFLSIRDTVDQIEMSNVHGKIYTEINEYMEEQNVANDSVPLVIYHSFSEKLIDIELGVPVADSMVAGNHRINMNKISAGNFVTAVHYGPYDRLPETYFGINEWMRKNKVVVTGPPWESYITDPALEPNPERWQTGIYFPVK